MDRNTEYMCPNKKGNCRSKFSEAQALRDTIKIKVKLEYQDKKIIQCPHCGCRVSKHRVGWILDKGRS